MKTERKLLKFKVKNNTELYIFADAIIAFRSWGDGLVRIFTHHETFDVENNITSVFTAMAVINAGEEVE